MKEEGLDPRVDRLVAALYGELSPSEERAFQRLLEEDPAIRAEWDELRASREMLSAWSVEERVPSFVMLERNGAARPSTWWARLTATLRMPAPAWGLAAAAAAAAFLVAEVRVNDKVERQLASRLSLPSGQASAVLPDAGGSDSAVGLGVPVELTGYLTRGEFDQNNDQLMQSLVTLLNDYGQRRDQDMLDLLQAMYERVNRQQLHDYRQLSGRLDDVGHELLLSRTLAEDRIESLLGPERTGDEAPAIGEEE